MSDLSPSPMPTLGERIRDARKRKNLSCVKAGAAAGVEPSHWYRVEHGQANPSVATLRRMAATVGLDDVVVALGADMRASA